MATTIERILQSGGLEAAVSSIAPREMGLTLDTERPVIGTTTGGAKFIGTEELISIVTAAPAALPLLRRSRVMCFVDTQAAGASVALDIQAGAQSAGYAIKVYVSGPDTRQCAVTYGAGLVEYIPAAMSQEFVWDGAKWNKTLMSWADRYEIGSYIESDFDDTPSAKRPIIKVWDSDHILDVANYPLWVAKARAEKVKAWSGAAYVTDHAVTVAGSVITGSGTAWDNMLAAIVEDVAVHGGYTGYRPANIAGVDFAISNISTVAHTMTVTGSPATGAQTCIVYARRIAGSNTTARTYKDSGRATMSPDGVLRMAGLRRRFHMQGHWHNWLMSNNGTGIANGSTNNWLVGGGLAFSGAISGFQNVLSTGSKNTVSITDAIADASGNGTPITGPENEPNSSTVYRTVWAGVLI
jgi:hypothetical protein